MTIRVWGRMQSRNIGVEQLIPAAPENAIKQSLCIVPGTAGANAGKLNNWF